MSGLINSLFGSGPVYPEPPNPAMVSGLQGKAAMDAYLQMLNDSRVNEVTPWGTQTWDKNTTFDQAGYDKALAEWKAASAGQTGQIDWNQYTKDNPDIIGSGMTPQQHYERYGKAEGRPVTYTANGVAQPTRSDYTTEQWETRMTLSPDQQELFDAAIASQKQQSGLLSGATDRVEGAMSNPMDWSGLPSLTGNVDAAQFSEFTGQNPDLQAPDVRDVNNIARTNISPEVQRYLDDIRGLDPQQFNNQAASAQYRAATRYLDPQVENQQKALEARLAEQGFVPGTPGYARAMETFQDTNNRAYADARDRATLLGANVGSDQFGNSLSALTTGMGGTFDLGAFKSGENAAYFGREMGLAGLDRQRGMDANSVAQQLYSNELNTLGVNNNIRAQQQNADTNAASFGNTARTQAIAEALTERNQPLNELNALKSGSQMTAPPPQTQYGTPNLATPDWGGNINSAYQQQVGNVSAETAYNNNQANSWMNLFSAGLMAPTGTFSNPFASNNLKNWISGTGGAGSTGVWGGTPTNPWYG